MFYEKKLNGYILRIRVTPNSSVSGFQDIFTDPSGTEYLKTNLNSAPEKGKANSELIKLLSKTLKISKSSFSVISGTTDRYKKVLLEIEHSETIEVILNNLENKK
jgi:uncharacterized protein YggU (UPF0235/DUF167 family)